MKSHYFLFAFLLLSWNLTAQIEDCSGAEVVCNSGTVSFNPVGIGIDDFASGGNNAGCMAGDENNSAWYYFEFDGTMPAGSQIEFTINPNGGAGEDYDFAVFGPDVDCGALGSPIRCSFAGSGCGFCPQTGLGNGTSDTSEGAGGDGFVSALTVQPGQGFYLLVDNWSGTSNGFDLTWSGNAAPFLNCNANPTCDLEANAGPDINLCVGDPAPFLSGNAINNMGAATFSWVELGGNTAFLSNPNIASPTLNIPNGFTGVLTFELTVAEGTCDDNDLVMVTVNPSPTANITGDLDFCTGMITILDAGPGFDSYLWSNGSPNQTIFVGLGGTYSVTVTSNGCSDVASVTVTELPNPTPAINGDLSICLGETGTLDAGLGYATYLWSDNSMNQTINFSLPGLYAVTVSDANGCIGNASILVNQEPAPTPTITGDIAVCDNGTAVLDAGGPYNNYIWSTGSMTQTTTVNASGFYTVTITDLNGCVGEGTATVFSSPSPTATITGNLQICPGGNTILDAGPGFNSYLWSDFSSGQTFTPTGPGTYSVTVTNIDGCEGVDEVTVDALPEPTPSITGDFTVCPGANTTLSVNGSYATYLWSDNSSGPTLTTSNPGQYSVTVTNANGCEGTTSVTVQANIPPTPSITGTLDICPNENTTLDAGAGYVSYLWSNTSEGQSITANAPGTYSVTVSGAEGCTGVASVNVLELPTPTPNILGDDSFCEGTATTLDAGLGYNSYSWSSGSNDQQIVADQPGIYTVTVEDNNGCEGTASLNVSSLPNPVPTISGDLAYCEDGFTILNGEAGFDTYLWSNGGMDPSLIVDAPGDYDLQVIDANGCIGTSSVSVVENPQPIPQIIGDLDFCQGQSTNLSLTENYTTYLWTTGSNDSDIDIMTPGNVGVEVTDANGCMGETMVNVVQFQNPVPEILGDFNFCEGLNTQLIGELGYNSYLWSNGSDEDNVTVSEGGTYTLTVIDVNGCEGDNSVAVIEDSLPMPEIGGELEFCTGTSTQLSVTENFDSYLWSNNSADQNIDISTPGTYSVTVNNSTGCEGEVSVIVSENDLPTVEITGELEFCENGNTTLSATPGFENYIWSDNSSNDALTVDQSGTYSVEVTDVNGCISNTSVDVSINSLPEPQIIGALQFCEDGTTLLELDQAYESYLWSTGSMSSNLEVNTPGDYSVIVTDNNNCQAEAEVTTELFAEFSPEISGAPSICSGEPTTLTAEDGFVSYSWSTNENTPAITVNQAGVYDLSVIDMNGCTGVASIEIMENELPTPSIEGVLYFCAGTDTQIQVTESYEAYNWSNTEETQGVDISVAGNYVVTVTDINGCQGTTNAFVEENDLPEPGISGLFEFCPEGSTILNAIGNFESYSWSNNSTETTITIDQIGVYTLEVTDEFGCIGTVSEEVNLFAVQIPPIDGQLEFCPEGNTNLSSGLAFETYTWSTGSIQSSIEIDQPGIYGLTVEDNNGCITENLVQVDLYLTTNPEITGEEEFCSGEAVNLSATAGFETYEWSTQEQSESIQVNQEGEFSVVVTDINGCETSTSFFVEENPLPDLMIGGSTSYCIGGSTTLNAGGVYEIYNWSGGSVESTLEVTTPGNYGLTVTDVNGCISEASVDVIEDTELNPVITGVFAFCPDESTVIDAGTGFATYQWSNNSDSQTLEISEPGIYSVTVTDDDGCFGDDQIEVQELISPSPTISGPVAYCAGETISLNTEAGYEDVLWSTGSMSVSIDISTPGTYSVLVTDSDGCTGEISQIVEELEVPVIDIKGQDFFCDGSSTELSVASNQVLVSYDWSDGTQNSNLNVNTAGIYTVEVANAGGCIETAEILIENIPNPVADAGLDEILNCNINSVILGGSNTTQGTQFIYTWTGPDIDLTNESEQYPEVELAGDYTLLVTDIDHNCTSEIAAVLVDDQTNDPAVIVQALDILDCSTSTIIIDGTDSEAGSSIVYQWYDNNGNMIEGANTPMLETSSPEIFILEVLDTITGCFNTASVEVEANVIYPIAEAGPAQLLNCYVPSLTLDGSASTSGMGITYLWSTANGNIQSGFGEIASVINEPGTYFLSVMDTINQCQNQDSVIISQDIASPIANAGLDQEIDCLTPSVDLNGSGSSSGANFAYEWTPVGNNDEILGTTTLIAVGAPGSYNLVVTDLNNGCTDTDIVVVEENGSFPTGLATLVDSPTCFGDTDGSIVIEDVVGGTPPYVYSFAGDDFSSGTTFANLGAGIYDLVVQDMIGCEYEIEVEIQDGNDLVLDLGEDIHINLGQSADLEAFSNVPYSELSSFAWDTRDSLNCIDCPENVVNPYETTDYAAMIIDENGCVATDQVIVFVNHPDEVFIPNAFSPNNDGLNDIFMIFAGEDVEVVNSFLVFNRWGETIFDVYNFPPNDPTFGWDGDFRARKYNSGVFVYLAEVTFIDGTTKIFKGDVAIIK